MQPRRGAHETRHAGQALSSRFSKKLEHYDYVRAARGRAAIDRALCYIPDNPSVQVRYVCDNIADSVECRRREIVNDSVFNELMATF
jgi:hypothetical protein